MPSDLLTLQFDPTKVGLAYGYLIVNHKYRNLTNSHVWSPNIYNIPCIPLFKPNHKIELLINKFVI